VSTDTLSGERPAAAVRRQTVALRAAVASWIAFVAIAVGAIVLDLAQRRLDIGGVATTLAFFVFASVGAVVVARLPTNTVGWTLLTVAIAAVGQALVSSYVAIAATDTALPFAPLAAWLDTWLWSISVGAAMIVLPAVFPDGHLPAGRERSLVWAMVALFAVAPVFLAVAPGPLPSLLSIENPLGLGLLAPVSRTGREVLPLLGVIPIAVCAAIPIARYRRAGTDERAQIKWFAFAAVLLAAVLVVNVLVDNALEVAQAICIALVPAAIGVAVLRYRLYDIDVLINRTLVWVPLTAMLGGLYAASVALLQRLFVNVTGDRSDAAIIITTLVLAGLFTPARRVLDAVVDTRFRVTPHVGTRVGQPDPVVDDELTRRIETIAERVAREVVAEEDRSRSRPERSGPIAPS
jgi:hypothetical protein